MFPQVHEPGGLAASDFTSMNSLRITIGRQPFDHLLYHFTLTYSNWESVSVCFSESFEAFSRGLAGGLVEAGRRAWQAPQRQPECGGQQPVGGSRVPRAVPRPDGLLPGRAATDQRPQGP